MNSYGATILALVMKVLVVHKQKEIIEQVRSVLSNGFIIHSSDSGLDGLLISRIQMFDLIICCTDLPVITGYEMIRSIRTNSMNRNTPVLFLSDLVDEKVEYLANALHVEALLQNAELSEGLPLFVQQHAVHQN